MERPSLVLGAVLALVAVTACRPSPTVVGFDAFTLKDPNRTYVQADGSVNARPVRVFRWYPARGASERAMTLADYVRQTFVSASDPSLPEAPDAVGQVLSNWVESGIGAPVPGERLEDLLASPVAAHLGAPAAPGRRGVVILAGSLVGPAFLHHRLGEALAADGLIAVTVAGLGPAAGERPSFADGGVDRLAADLDLALHRVLAMPEADATRVGGVAWSMGGLALSSMELAEPRFDVVVSLDSGLGYDYGAAATAALPDDSRARLTAPFVHIAADPPATVPQDFSYFTLAAPREGWWRRESRLTHPRFNSLGMLGAEVTEPDATTLGDAQRSVIDDARAAIRAYLLHDADARRLVEERFERRR